MKDQRRFICLGTAVVVFAALLSLTAATNPDQPAGENQARKIRIVLAGDSTVTTNAGWGIGFANCLTNAECINLSRGGRSSGSFVAEGSWKKCLDLKPDYVLIQFGHNDQPGHGPERETDPKTSYRTNMMRYVTDALAAGIKPVLVTSMSRRQWGADGKIHSTLEPYVATVKEIAAEKNVPVLDLHSRSVELYESLGKQKFYEFSPTKARSTNDVTNTVSNADAPGEGNLVYDGTHLNAKGSALVGPIVAAELKKVLPVLAPYIK